MSSQKAAITNNEKVFPIFVKKLSSDKEDVFCSTATKLSAWLNSEKAYYPDARPNIVNLLETAQSTLRRKKGGDPNEPFHVSTFPANLATWVNAYTKLCRTLLPYLSLFPERTLQERLHSLMQTCDISVSPTSQLDEPRTQLAVQSTFQPGLQEYEPSTSAIRSTLPHQSTSSSSTSAHGGNGLEPASISREASPPPPSNVIASSTSAHGGNGLEPASIFREASLPLPSNVIASSQPKFPVTLKAERGSLDKRETDKGTGMPAINSAEPASATTPQSSPIETPTSGTSARPRLPPIRIPARSPIQTNIHTNTVSSAPTAQPAPARWTQPTNVTDGSLYSSGPLPSRSTIAETSTPAPVKEKKKKKKKIVIPEHLADADLEWLKAKQRESFEGMIVPAASVEVGNASGSVQETRSINVGAAVPQGVDNTGQQLHGRTVELDVRAEPVNTVLPMSESVTSTAPEWDLPVPPSKAIKSAIEHPISSIHLHSEPQPDIDPMDINVPSTWADGSTHPQWAEQDTKPTRHVDAMISDMPVDVRTAANDIETLVENVIPPDDVVAADATQTAPSAVVYQHVPTPEDVQPASESERAGLHVERSVKEAAVAPGDEIMEHPRIEVDSQGATGDMLIPSANLFASDPDLHIGISNPTVTKESESVIANLNRLEIAGDHIVNNEVTLRPQGDGLLAISATTVDVATAFDGVIPANVFPPQVLTASESQSLLPHPSTHDDNIAAHLRLANEASVVEISTEPEPRPNGHSAHGRKRARSLSIRSDHSSSRRRLDNSSSPLFRAFNTNIVSSLPVKTESVSEMDVLNFLNTIPLKEETANLATGMVLAQEPRRIQFGSEMVVIAAKRGSSSNTSITIEFGIDDNQMSLISLWRSRNKTQNDVSRSLCLTLACYRWADIDSNAQRIGGTSSREELVSSVDCSWPITGGLSMVARHNEDEWQLPLSPPLCENSENLIDISQFIKAPKSTIRILQTRDMSGFFLVLHAHHPTQKQLQVVEERRERDRIWYDYLQQWKQPLDVPLFWSDSISTE